MAIMTADIQPTVLKYSHTISVVLKHYKNVVVLNH